MKYHIPFSSNEPLRKQIQDYYLKDEEQCVDDLLMYFSSHKHDSAGIERTAYKLVDTIRGEDQKLGGIDSFLQEFKLSSEEGIALMCLAEALLRIPDKYSSDDLIKDKLNDKDWASHIGHSDSLFVNASSWGLMLTGKFTGLTRDIEKNPKNYLTNIVTKTGDPVLRKAMDIAMRVMGKQFVMAETIKFALKQAKKKQQQGYSYSYDMLGEAARTRVDAENYFKAYSDSIHAIGKSANTDTAVKNPGISVKLSALHPRYEYNQEQGVMQELLPQIQALCLLAADYNIGLTIDAEESERLEPSLSILQALCEDTRLKEWDGLGFVIQAYQKRAPTVLDWIESLASKHNRRIMIRLVKGAYWDSEIKHAQQNGLEDYPVYTQKFTTDVAYLRCVDKLLANESAFYPLFATHNAHTVAYVLKTARDKSYEFQCLHGMGEILYDQVVKHTQKPVRIYAPVGNHKDLLAYLVRRLLENGANSSFVNRLIDKELPINEIVANPIEKLQQAECKRHPKIGRPSEMFPDRINSSGLNLDDSSEISTLFNQLTKLDSKKWSLESVGKTIDILNPATGEVVGDYLESSEEDIEIAIKNAKAAFETWDNKKGNARAEILEKAADLYESNRAELISLCMLEAGKILVDADGEVREAVDFLRYYAQQARKLFEDPSDLLGPTGETNQHWLSGRGTFVCISPWNFPLAIFTGQLGAALAAGNCVLAKPAEQTPLIATRAIELLHEAGVPKGVIQLLLGTGATVGSALTQHPDINGVTFTGSTQTAQLILKSIVSKAGPIIPFIAETGGLNSMIADSSTLIEQLVDDCIQSAFQSAGQRCSALRVLYVQKDIYQQVVTDLKGAMDLLITGDTRSLDIDIGPIIDDAALSNLKQHIKELRDQGKSVYSSPEPDLKVSAKGSFLAPTFIEIESITELEEEVFGPILHIAPYAATDLDRVITDINNTGFGLTFGIHSRVNSKVKYISERIKAGNIYANRNTIGAVVGVQPFGGEGLSGTGPKAGGTHYLPRFANERVLSIDTTAAGGNASLLSL